MARPLLKFALTGSRPASSLPDAPVSAAVGSSASGLRSAPGGQAAQPTVLEILRGDFSLLSLEGAAASRALAVAAGSTGLLAVARRDAAKAGGQWWAVLEAELAAEAAPDAEARPVAALCVTQCPGEPPEALAALCRELQEAGLQPWPLGAGEEEMLLIDRARLTEAALALVRAGHAVGPPSRVALSRAKDEEGDLEAEEAEKFAGVWRLTSRERPPGTVVEKFSRGDGPMRIQAPSGVYAELAVRTPGKVLGQDSSCGVLSVSEEDGETVAVRRAALGFAPPAVAPRRCRVAIDAGGGDEGEDIAVETTLIAEGGVPEVERWERIGTGDVTVLELRPREGDGRAGFWLFCGRHWVRVTGLPPGRGLLPGACCRSLAQAQELYGDAAVLEELRAYFDACCGIIERPGFLSVLRRAWSAVTDPVYYDAGSRSSEVRKDGDVIVHTPREGGPTSWDVRAFAIDPFTPAPKRLAKPAAPEGLRRKTQSSSSEASSSSGKASKAKKKKARDSSSDSSRQAKKKDSKKSRRSQSRSSSSSAARRRKGREKDRDRSRSRDKGKKDRSHDRARGRRSGSAGSRESGDRGRDRDRSRRGGKSRSRDRARDKSRSRDKKDKDRERSRERDRSKKDKDRSRSRDRSRDRDRDKKEKDRDKSRRESRDGSRDREKEKKEKEKDRSRGRDREKKDKEKDRKRDSSSSSGSAKKKGKDRKGSRKRDSSDDSDDKKRKASPKKKDKDAKKSKSPPRRRAPSSSSSDEKAKKKKAKSKPKKAASSDSSSASSTAKKKNGAVADKKRKAKDSSSDGDSDGGTTSN